MPGSLSTIAKELDKRFIKCSRSLYVNVEQVEHYDTKLNVITFKNNEKLEAVAREKRKELESLYE